MRDQGPPTHLLGGSDAHEVEHRGGHIRENARFNGVDPIGDGDNRHQICRVRGVG